MAWYNSDKYGRNDFPITTAPTSPFLPPMQPGIPMVQQGASATLPQGSWPPPRANCPRGLERLVDLDRLIVNQQMELFEIMTGFETENKYIVKDAQGQVAYYATEESTDCSRMCCGNARAFDMRIVDASIMSEVLLLKRPQDCWSCCLCPWTLKEMDVFCNGEKIGSVRENWSPMRASFSVCDANGSSALCVKGPICTACHPCTCADVHFKVLSGDGKYQVGEVSKKWTGWAREACTDADVFGISFPGDLDVKLKAVLFGACFLIDFKYFENNQANRRR